MKKNSYSSVRYKHLLLTLLLVIGCKSKPSNEDHQVVKNTWYRNAVIYNLDVKVFKDSDGDGMGDFKGLIQKLPYLDSLGIDVIWLSPFQPSPGKDDGYDVTDFYEIDKKLGTEADFEAFMATAKEKGIKVIMDIVLNHTSIEHNWYQNARSDSTSKYHSWYVWSKEKPKDWDKGMVFPGVQNATWTFDEVAGKYYFHRFYDFQPDLNYENPEVQQEAKAILTHWVKKGLDGFRLDAVPFIIDIPKTGSKDPEHMFPILTDLRETVKKLNPEAVLLGEANVTAEENKEFFGKNANRLQMMFHFYANQHLFHSLAVEKPADFEEALKDFKEKPAEAQWAFFLRNHDEIDLARLSSRKRKAVFDKFGPKTNMQLYDRGIRRRLAPMLQNPEQLKMTYSLLFSLPGAPVIRYGEEIGMGDELALPERLSVRTPMQWSDEKNAGFSTAEKTFRPMIAVGDYAFQKINVEEQTENPISLLNFIKSLINTRKNYPEFGLASWEIVKTDQKNLLVIKYHHPNKNLLTIHNFSNKNQELSSSEIGEPTLLTDILEQQNKLSAKKTIKLKPYGFKWFEITKN